MNDTLYLKQSEADFNALRKASEEVAEQVNLIQVTDPQTLAIAHQQLSLLKAKITAVENLRVKLKQPSLDEGRAIDALAKKLSSPMTDALENGKKKILAFEQAEKERVNKLKEKISAYSTAACNAFSKCITIEDLEKAYNLYVKAFPPDSLWQDLLPEAQEMRLLLRDFASQRKLAILNPTEVDDETTTTIEEAIVDTVQSVEVEKGKGIRQNWKARVVDISAVPNEWKIFDEAAAKDWRKRNADTIKDGDIKHGVQFYIEESLTIR